MVIGNELHAVTLDGRTIDDTGTATWKPFRFIARNEGVFNENW